MATSAPNPLLVNAQARQIIIGSAVKMTLPLASLSINSATQQIINIEPRPVGMIIGFIIEVSATATNGATTQANRTPFGSANILRNVTFSDMNNVQRINTTGSHLALVNSARQGFGFGGAYAPNLPMGFGNNWSPFAGPVSLAANAAGTVRHTYYVPLAYSSSDLTGAVFAGVVNATMNLQITLNTTPFVGVGANGLNAIYTDNATGAWTGNHTINVYQVILDQLPRSGDGRLILPERDLNTIYDLKYTNRNGLTVGQDFTLPYANFRRFLSTTLTYDNGGVFGVGADVNRFILRAANSTNLWEISPNIAALLARQVFMCDPPAGTYYFDHRDRPVDTITYGNMELVVNPSVVNANAQCIVGYESFTAANDLGSATSL